MRGMLAETNVNAEESETAITVAAVVIQLMWTMVVMEMDKDARMRWIWWRDRCLQSRIEAREGLCVFCCFAS